MESEEDDMALEILTEEIEKTKSFFLRFMKMKVHCKLEEWEEAVEEGKEIAQFETLLGVHGKVYRGLMKMAMIEK
jgi:G3E family GTPase